MRLLAVVLALCSTVATSAPRHERGAAPARLFLQADSCPGLDVLHYRLDIEILPETRELYGAAMLTMQATGNPLEAIPLDLEVLQVACVLEGQDSVPFQPTGHGVVLLPPSPLLPGQPRTFLVEYGGHPGNEGGPSPWGGFFFTGSMAYSVGVGLWADPPSMGRYWFPGHDVPADKATAEVTLRVPVPWVGISNGRLVADSTEGSTRITHWATDLPIATYLMAVAAGPYVELADSAEGVPIRHYVLGSQVDRARASFVHVPQMISLFSRLFGTYPFERFGYVSSALSGGMEHQTMVTLGSFAINGLLTWEPLLAHELSHQWWGDCVTYADWTQVWVSEGFATYCEALWAEETQGQAGYVTAVTAMMQEYLGSGEHYFPLNDPAVLWGSATYEKGACVLHMLRQLVGDSVFFEGLAQLREACGYAHATTDSVEAAFERATGGDLTWFFDQWVRQPGHPELALRLTTYPYLNGDTGVELEVSQLQTVGPVFRFPLEVVCHTPSGPFRFSFFDSLPVQVARFSVAGTVTSVQIDPDHDLLFRHLGTTMSDRLLLARVTVDDLGDGDGALDQGEEASLVLGVFNPFDELGSSTMELVCDDPSLIVLQGTSILPSIPAGATTSNASEPFRVCATDGPSHPVSASVRIVTTDGAAITVGLPLHLGVSKRLLVDDAGSGNPYAPYYLTALDTLPLGDSRELWRTALQGAPSAQRLQKYASQGMVTWFTGDVDSCALKEEEVFALASFLDAGGALFLTGQNALDDLPSSPHGAAFLADYLRLEVVHVNYPATKAFMGYAGDPIGNGLMGVIQGGGGANNQTSLTVVAPTEGASSVLYYRNTSLDCAIRSAERGRVVVFSFGFEAINETQPQFVSRQEMIRRVADWLEGPGTGGVEAPLPLVRVFVPTPMRGACPVRMELGEPTRVGLDLYDLAGRRVDRVFSGDLHAGTTWVDLTRLAPGVYLLVTTTPRLILRSPLIVIP